MLDVAVLLAFVVDRHCFCSYHRYCYCCCYYGSQLVSLICPLFYKAGDGCGDDYGDKAGDDCGDALVIVTRMIRTSVGFLNQYRQ